MTEQDYIKATNRVKASIALTILCDVLTTDTEEYGITTQEIQEITKRLSNAQDKLFASYETKESAL